MDVKSKVPLYPIKRCVLTIKCSCDVLLQIDTLKDKMSELKDCPPLKYYDFKPVEHTKVCPRYTAVLGRSEDDGIGIEELDTLQLELGTLLSSASRRLRALEEQRQVKEIPILTYCWLACSFSIRAKYTLYTIYICCFHYRF